MRSRHEHPGLHLFVLGRVRCDPHPLPPPNVSHFLNGEVRSDMHNAKSVLMYAAKMRRSQIPEAEKKGTACLNEDM